jgi:tetratricopeptide (TPR) repeat protein
MGAALLGAAVLAAGCAGMRLPGGLGEGNSGARDVTRAASLAAEGRPRDARELYESVIRDHRKEPAAADALYGLAILQVEPKSPLRDYSAARANFQRLLAEHPDSPHAAEARAWRAALGEIERCSTDAARLRQDMERLKRLDLEQEVPR